MSRDRIEERGGKNLYGCVKNRLPNSFDGRGLSIVSWYRSWECKGCPDMSNDISVWQSQNFEVMGEFEITIVFAGPTIEGEFDDGEIELPPIEGWVDGSSAEDESKEKMTKCKSEGSGKCNL